MRGTSLNTFHTLRTMANFFYENEHFYRNMSDEFMQINYWTMRRELGPLCMYYRNLVGFFFSNLAVFSLFKICLAEIGILKIFNL